MARPERALDSSAGPLAQFASGLRRLRVKAGRPTYRTLARTAKYSSSTLSVAASGRHLPSLAVTLAFVKACGGDPVEWEARWRELTGQAVTAPPAAVTGGPGPYRGLPAYQPHDGEWFFGRDRVVSRTVGVLATRRLLMVSGPGGCGTSSVLRAGVLPRIARHGLSGRRGWPVLLMTPGTAPLAGLAARLAPLVGVPAAELRAGAHAGSDWLDTVARRSLLRRPPDVELLVIVDQFEELWTQCADPAERAVFAGMLAAATRGRSSRTRVIVGVRGDYVPRCAELPGLAGLAAAPLRVAPIGGAELRESIVRSARHAGLMVDGQLVSTVVARVAEAPDALPLASHALLEAWRRRRGSAITMAGYVEAGGVESAVAQTAEGVYAGLDELQRQTVRGLLVRLIRIGDTGRLVSTRLDRAELDAAGPDARAALEQLARAGLVVVGPEGVAVAHEALGRAWPRLRRWIDATSDHQLMAAS